MCYEKESARFWIHLDTTVRDIHISICYSNYYIHTPREMVPDPDPNSPKNLSVFMYKDYTYTYVLYRQKG